MKEIKAYVHRTRIADVVRALEQAGYRNLSIIDVKGMLKEVDPKKTGDINIEDFIKRVLK